MQGRYPKVTIVQDNVPVMTIQTKHHAETTPLLSSTSYQQHEQKKNSLLPYMILLLLCFTVVWILCGIHQTLLPWSVASPLLSVPLLQGVWALLIIHFGRRYQSFVQEQMLRSFIILWLPLVPIVLQVTVFTLNAQRWKFVADMIEASLPSLILLQALRTLAVGALLKWRMGLFPTAFALGTALPDMLFGLSAFVLWWWWHGTMVMPLLLEHPLLLLLWNAVGFVIIVPVGLVIVQSGMEPTRLYVSDKPYSLVFEYPMVLGPAVVVPILLSWNVIMILFASERLQSR